MRKTFVATLSALALLTGCPDSKAPKDPTKLPMPTTAPAGPSAGEPKASN